MANLDIIEIFQSQLKDHIKEYYKLQERNNRDAFTDHTCYTHLKIMEHLIQSGDIDLMTQSLKEQCDSNQYQQQFGIKPNRPLLRFQEVVVWMMINRRDEYQNIFKQIQNTQIQKTVLKQTNDFNYVRQQLATASNNVSGMEQTLFSVTDNIHNALKSLFKMFETPKPNNIEFHDISDPDELHTPDTFMET